MFAKARDIQDDAARLAHFYQLLDYQSKFATASLQDRAISFKPTKSETRYPPCFN
jgi:hypothetical protein